MKEPRYDVWAGPRTNASNGLKLLTEDLPDLKEATMAAVTAFMYGYQVQHEGIPTQFVVKTSRFTVDNDKQTSSPA